MSSGGDTLSDHNNQPNMLSTVVRTRRRELGLTVKSVAGKAGMTAFRWNWIERANAPRLPDPVTVAGMATALAVAPDVLVRAAGYDFGEEV